MELTTSQAVRKYGVFPGALHRLILLGRLKAHKNEFGVWMISKDSLETWNRNRTRKTPKSKQVGVSATA